MRPKRSRAEVGAVRNRPLGREPLRSVMAVWRFFNTPLQALIRELPLRALLPLALAIFALFSVLGPVNDVINGANRPLPFLIRNGILAGVFALGYAYGSLRGPHRISS